MDDARSRFFERIRTSGGRVMERWKTIGEIIISKAIPEFPVMCEQDLLKSGELIVRDADAQAALAAKDARIKELEAARDLNWTFFEQERAYRAQEKAERDTLLTDAVWAMEICDVYFKSG